MAHPWNPVHLIPLVEICLGELTSKETLYRTRDLMDRIGKIPVVLRKEVPGFIGNRLSAALWREALGLVDKGVASVEGCRQGRLGWTWVEMGINRPLHDISPRGRG